MHKFSVVPFILRCVVVLMSFLLNSHGYDIGCIYPNELGDDPIQTRIMHGDQLIGLVTGLINENEMTQPFMARFGLYVTGCSALCLAYHDPDVKDPFTQFPTFFTVPVFGQNAYSVLMCEAQCWEYVWPTYMESGMKSYFHNLGLDVTEPSERMDIVDALQQNFYMGSPTELETILLTDDFHPFTIGHIAGVMIKQRLKYDGFNEDGEMMWDKTLEQEVPCTANCRPFQPTTGYQPMPDPRKYSFLNTDTSKYDCTGYCRHWQPVLDKGTPSGTISRKEYTLPHIGYSATPYLRDATLTLQDPNYDYYNESLDVVERLRETSGDSAKKMLISLFRGEPNFGMHGLRGPIQVQVNENYVDDLSYQEMILQFFAVSLIEYDAIIQVWKEKVEHDLVRPSTIIQQWGDDVLNTFGGDIDFYGPQDIAARNFETILPPIDSSAEFPSIHSCFCTTLMEFWDTYLLQMHGETLTNFTVAVPGYDNALTFPDMEEYRDKCGESMLWAGDRKSVV